MALRCRGRQRRFLAYLERRLLWVPRRPLMGRQVAQQVLLAQTKARVKKKNRKGDSKFHVAITERSHAMREVLTLKWGLFLGALCTPFLLNGLFFVNNLIFVACITGCLIISFVTSEESTKRWIEKLFFLLLLVLGVISLPSSYSQQKRFNESLERTRALGSQHNVVVPPEKSTVPLEKSIREDRQASHRESEAE